MNAAECAAQGVKVHRQAAENVVFQTCQEKQEQTGAQKNDVTSTPSPPNHFLT